MEHSPTHWLAKLTTDQLEECSKQGGPWHIRLDFLEPHLPCRPCEEFLQWYREEEIPEWEGLDCQSLLKNFRKRLYEILVQEEDGMIGMEWMRNQLLGITVKL